MKTSPADDSAPTADSGRADILIVDDRPDKLLVYQTILEELGQRLFVADSGQQALKQVLERDFAVILLDVNMPGMDGLETAALIRNRSRSAHVPIIFITADYNDEHHMARGYALGAVDYIGLPVVPEILRAKVKVFVELYLLAEQAKRQAEEHMALLDERIARAAAEEATRSLAFLAAASATLSGLLDINAITRELVRLCVPVVGGAAALTLVQESPADPAGERLWPRDAGHDPHSRVSSPELAGVAIPQVEQALERVLAGGKPEVITNLAPFATEETPQGQPPADTMRPATDIHSVAVIPLVARGRTLGALSLGLADPARWFDTDTLSMATELAGRAAIALDNARLYAKMQEQDRRKDEFLAMLAHELRNPLAPISNAVYVLRALEGDPGKIGWARDVIGRQLKQLVRLVDDLLDVSRITHGRIELKSEAIDVARAVAAAVETSRPYVDAAEHSLAVSLPQEPLQVKGDSARVAQILANLVNNAARYTDKGGMIELSATREGGEIVFRVRDNGIGIPPEAMPTIFDAFHQLDRRLDRSRGGLGVGLTLARRLVEMQGGSISAQSEGAGRGSEFTVRLPSASAIAAQPRQDAAAHETVCAKPLDLRVLIAEDNRDVADSTALLLRAAGCNVDLAYDGEEALRSVRALKPDAVLLDIGLPKIDGYEVAERIRAQDARHGPLLIALSGYGQDEYRQRSKVAGFDYHIVKPIEPTALTGLLETLWSSRKTRAPTAG